MNTFTVVLGVVLAVVGVRGTFSEDDQSYSKSKRGLTVVPAPSLAPAAYAAHAYPAQAYAHAYPAQAYAAHAYPAQAYAQAYYPAAAVSPYFGVAKAAYLPAASLYSRPAPAYYSAAPAVAATGYAPAYSAPAPAPAPAAAVPAYSVPAAYSSPAAAYASAPVAALARAPHLASPQLAYSYYG